MARSKPNFKEIFLKKGEKIILGVCVGFCLLLVVLGFMSMADAKNPTELVKQVDGSAKSLQGQINNQTPGNYEELPDWAQKEDGISFPSVSSSKFQFKNLPYEPVQWPSTRRENPMVLAPIDSQVFYITGAYKGYDRLFEERDGQLMVRIGLIQTETKAGTFEFNDLVNKLKNPNIRRPRQPGGVAVAPMDPNQPQQQPQPPQMNIAPTARDERKVVYKTLEEAMTSGLPPAKRIFPVRMGVVMLSYPLKDQLEEIKKALRLRNLAEARYESSKAVIDARSVRPGAPGTQPTPAPMPVRPPDGQPNPNNPNATGIDTETLPAFTGLIVERRVTTPDGKSSKWEQFNHQERFFDKFSRYDTPYVQETGHLPYFIRPDLGLSAPLPVIVDGQLMNYPPSVSLKSISQNYQRLLAERAPPKNSNDVNQRFQNPNPDNTYLPSNNTLAGGDLALQQTTIAPSAEARIDNQQGDPNVMNPNRVDVEYLLLRFLDPDILPNHTYEYRVKVRMKNPNFRNAAQVATESIAKDEYLEGAWYEVPQKIFGHLEDFTYAYPAKRYEDSAKKLIDECGKPDILGRVLEIKDVNEGRKAVIQMQRWFEYYGNEPVGNWIQAEMTVGPGEYLGKRTIVSLPIWQSSIRDPNIRPGNSPAPSPMPNPNMAMAANANDPFVGGFILPALEAKSAITGWPPDSPTKKYTNPRGRLISFQTRHVLIDFDGGRVNSKVGNSTIVDDTSSELLILRDDDRIEVRSEAVDMADPDGKSKRAYRDATFAKWIKKVRDASPLEGTAVPTPTNPNLRQ